MDNIFLELKAALGPTYGGPSLSVEGDKFVLYAWTDAPVGEELLASGDTLEECLNSYKEYLDGV